MNLLLGTITLVCVLMLTACLVTFTDNAPSGERWAEPVIYAIGTGMLTIQLFEETYEVGGGDGIFHRIMDAAVNDHSKTLVVVGAVLSVLVLLVGSVQIVNKEEEVTISNLKIKMGTYFLLRSKVGLRVLKLLLLLIMNVIVQKIAQTNLD